MQGIAVVDLALKRPVVLPSHVFNNNGAFAPGIVAGDRVFIGGQLGRDPLRQYVPETAAEQAQIALRRFEEVLHAAGLDWARVVALHGFTAGLDRGGVEAIEVALAAKFKNHCGHSGPPAGILTSCEGLPNHAQFALTGVAAVDRSVRRLLRTPMSSVVPRSVFSPGAFVNATCYISACSQGAKAGAATTRQQLEQCLEQLDRTLDAAGLKPSNCASSQLYVPVDENVSLDLKPLNEPWTRLFTTKPYPARAPLPIPLRLPDKGGTALPREGMEKETVQITLVAVSPDGGAK